MKTTKNSYWKSEALPRLWPLLVADGNQSTAYAKVMTAIGCSNTKAVSLGKGDYVPDADEVYDLAAAAGCTVSFLLGFDAA